MSKVKETKEVTAVGTHTVTLSQEHREAVQAIIDYGNAAVNIGEKILSLPLIMSDVLLNNVTQDAWQKSTGFPKNEVTVLYYTATIVKGTSITSPEVALSVYEFVRKCGRTTGVKMDDAVARFKVKTTAKSLDGSPITRWVQGDLDVRSKLATNGVEQVRHERKALAIAQGKAPRAQVIKTPAIRLSELERTAAGLVEALTVTGITDDVRAETGKFVETINELLAILLAN